MGLKVFKFSFKMGWKLQEDEIEVMVCLVRAKKKGGFMGRNRHFY